MHIEFPDGQDKIIIQGIPREAEQAQQQLVDITRDLLSICWESKLDFTEYLDSFISAFLNGTYESSIEAFTMIEKIFMDYEMPAEKLRKTIQSIRMSYPDLTENKRELALVLLDGLQTRED